MYTGPNTVKKELLYGHDSGYGVANNTTSTRFYKGEPTTNATPLTNFINTSNWTGGGWQGSIAVASDYENTLEITAYNGWRTFAINHGITTGGTVSVSFEYRLKSQQTDSIFGLVLNGRNLGNFHNNLGNISNSDLESGGWKTYTGSFTANSNTYGAELAIGLRGSDNGGLSDTMYVRKLQVELKDHVTPYTESSRTSANSLINFKDSDSSSYTLSFNSTGQPTFDGTDDRILVNPGTFPASFASPFSLEVIYYVPNSASWSGVSPARQTTIMARGGYAGVWGLCRFSTNNLIGAYVRTGSSSTTYDVTHTIERDKFYHIVGTWNGNNKLTLYVNGVNVGNETSGYTGTSCDNTGNIQIGGGNSFAGSNGGFAQGDIPVAKIYKECLTDNDVKQNFDAYKNRFNI